MLYCCLPTPILLLIITRLCLLVVCVYVFNCCAGAANVLSGALVTDAQGKESKSLICTLISYLCMPWQLMQMEMCFVLLVCLKWCSKWASLTQVQSRFVCGNMEKTILFGKHTSGAWIFQRWKTRPRTETRLFLSAILYSLSKKKQQTTDFCSVLLKKEPFWRKSLLFHRFMP